MKTVENPPSRTPLILYRILLFLILLLAILILAGTIYAVFREKDSGPLFGIGKPAGNAQVNGSSSPAPGTGSPGTGISGTGEASIFTGIGRLRIPVRDTVGGSTTVILSVAFPYPLRDRPFTEELASKVTDFRRIATDYFSSLSPSDLVDFDENTAKAEILKRYNAQLRLGKITVLYFDDLMVID
jgi:flagellar basal body-associated protein FliL